MRVALLSVLDGQSEPRKTGAPFRMLAGARLVERQLDIALAAGCEVIACLADTVGREVIELQHRAEAGGARFIALQAKLECAEVLVTELRRVAAAELAQPKLVGKELSSL